MSYIDKSLTNDERIIYRANVSKWSLFPLIFLGVLLMFPFGVGLILLLWAYIIYKTTEAGITNKKVIAKSGFISRHTIEMNLHKTESIQISQSILGRIFNYGSIQISGAGNPQAPIKGIYDPLSFRRAFLEIQESANAERK